MKYNHIEIKMIRKMGSVKKEYRIHNKKLGC